jgi:hypothetical protein
MLDSLDSDPPIHAMPALSDVRTWHLKQRLVGSSTQKHIASAFFHFGVYQ